MNSDNIDFVTYCIGNLSRRLGLNARDVYHRLKTSGILADLIFYTDNHIYSQFIKVSFAKIVNIGLIYYLCNI